jgi:hypothetical protein
MRESGTLGNATVFSNYIILGFFLNVLLGMRSEHKRTLLLCYATLLIMGVALLLAGSRYPLIIAVMLLLIYSGRNMSLRRAVLFWAITLALSATWLWQFAAGIIDRSLSDPAGGGRLEKTLLGLRLVGAQFSHLMFGVPLELISSAETSGGFSISDNSYVMVLLNFGLPFTVLWLISLYKVLRRTVCIRSNGMLLLYFVLGIGITNGILWDVWVLTYFAALFCLERESPRERQYRQRSSEGATQPEPRDVSA